MESRDILVDIFGRIENFFVRLEIYTKVPLTPAMTDKMVQITVEILDILATVTKEMEQSLGSKSDLRRRIHDAYIVSDKFIKRVIGRRDLEDGMKKIDKLINEEVAMASPQLLKAAHNIDITMTEVLEGVRRVDENMLVVKGEVELVNENVKALDGKLQIMADGRQRHL